MKLLSVFISLVQCNVVYSQLSSNPEELRDWCLDGVDHKEKPGSEDELHKQCSPWKDRSCCTFNSSLANHEDLHRYRFNRHHCKPLSPKCEEHFIQDLCFYDCEPNLGPWIVKVKMIIRNERFMYVPLCASDCDTWFEACENDLTCVDNWSRGFKRGNGTNHCPQQKPCKTFREIFGNSKNFCEKVWDDSWKYTPDDQPCMRIWFDGAKGNPNEQVRDFRIAELFANCSCHHLNWFWLIITTILLLHTFLSRN